MRARSKTPRGDILASVAAFLIIGFFVMFIGISLLVGLTSLSPRAAALVLLAPALILGAVGAAIRPLRDFFANPWIIS